MLSHDIVVCHIISRSCVSIDEKKTTETVTRQWISIHIEESYISGIEGDNWIFMFIVSKIDVQRAHRRVQHWYYYHFQDLWQESLNPDTCCPWETFWYWLTRSTGFLQPVRGQYHNIYISHRRLSFILNQRFIKRWSWSCSDVCHSFLSCCMYALWL